MTRLAIATPLTPHSHYWELPIYLGITQLRSATFYLYIALLLHIKVLVLLFVSIIRGKLAQIGGTDRALRDCDIVTL